jgi:uncharacterized SAM-binding protein YcdF (DUF218 family)
MGGVAEGFLERKPTLFPKNRLRAWALLWSWTCTNSGFMRRTPRILRVFAMIVMIGAVLVHTPLSYYYSWPLREESHPVPSDVIVLLSSGQLGKWLSLDGAQRTWGALSLFRSGYATRIISSGTAREAYGKQAETQAQMLFDAGVPRDAVIVEKRSSRTYESAREVAAVMREHRWSTAVIVTSQLDIPRARRVFDRQGIITTFLAIPEYGPPTGPLYIPGGFMTFYHASYEYAGLLLYKIRGWI